MSATTTISNAISPKRLPARLADSSDEEIEVVPRYNTPSDIQGIEASSRMQQVLRLPDATVVVQTQIGYYPPVSSQSLQYPPFAQYGYQQTPMPVAYGYSVPQGGVYGYNAPAYMTPYPPIFSTPYHVPQSFPHSDSTTTVRPSRYLVEDDSGSEPDVSGPSQTRVRPARRVVDTFD